MKGLVSALQDAAAGGGQLRKVRLTDRSIVRVFISVRRFKRYIDREYAYLQFRHGDRTVTKYVGKVTSESKEAALIKGWALLRERRLIESLGWEWVEPSPQSSRESSQSE